MPRMGASRIAFAFFLAVGLLSGCGKEPADAPKRSISVFTADPGTVIARVDGREITVGDFRERLEFETAVHRLTMQNAKNPPKDAEKRVRKFSDYRARQVLPQLIHCALLDGYLERECGGREAAGADKAVAKTLKRYAKKLRQKGLTLDDFAGRLSVRPEYLREQLILPAREDKARLRFDPASTNVTEKEIDEGLARLDAYMARAAASNRVTWATCSNVLAQVRAGADFKKVGRRYGAVDTGEEDEWGWFGRDDFDLLAKNDPSFKEWAFKAKVGEIGGPFDLDDGLSIVKIIARQDGAATRSMAAKSTEEVQLVRINFEMVDEHPEPRTREHCREALLDWKARDAQKRLFEKLFKDAKIEYPNGMKMNFKRRD